MVRYSAEEAQGRGIGAKEVLGLVERSLSQSKEIVGLGYYKNEQVFSTGELLEIERSIIKSAKRYQGDHRFVVASGIVQGRISQYPTLSEEQQEAIKYITEDRGRVKLVSGMAGTGKSFMLRVARESWEAGGLKVVGAALLNPAF